MARGLKIWPVFDLGYVCWAGFYAFTKHDMPQENSFLWKQVTLTCFQFETCFLDSAKDFLKSLHILVKALTENNDTIYINQALDLLQTLYCYFPCFLESRGCIIQTTMHMGHFNMTIFAHKCCLGNVFSLCTSHL